MMAEEHLGTDIAMINHQLSATLGDVDLVTERKCYIQDLNNRLSTPKGDLWCHREYGVDLYRFLHLEATHVNQLDLLRTIQEEAENDPRTKSAKASIISWDGKKVKIALRIYPIDESGPINLVLGYDLATMTMEVVNGG